MREIYDPSPVVALAYRTAVERGDNFIGPEHLLIAICNSGSTPLLARGIDPAAVLGLITQALGPGLGMSTRDCDVTPNRVLTENARRAIQVASEVASCSGRVRLTADDLLEGLLEAESGTGISGAVFISLGSDPWAIQAELRDRRNGRRSE